MKKNVKWTYHESSGEHSGQGTIFGVCPYGFGLRWDISGHWYRGFAQNFDIFHMGRVVWPAEPFLKKCPNIRKRLLFPKYVCPFFQEQVPKMSFSPSVPRQLPKQRGARGAEPLENAGDVWGRRSPPPRRMHLYSISRFTGHQNGWSFSISRKAGYIRMVGPSVFPEKQVISKWLDFQYFQVHRSKNQVRNNF